MSKLSSPIVYLIILLLIALGIHQLLNMHSDKNYEKTVVAVNQFPVTVDIAKTNAQVTLGLGGRPRLAENQGMFFVFPSSQPLGFWMKDMLIPIDIIWLNSQCQVIHIEASLQPCPIEGNCPIYTPNMNAQYVLETAAGFAQRHNIVVGQTVVHQLPTQSGDTKFCS